MPGPAVNQHDSMPPVPSSRVGNPADHALICRAASPVPAAREVSIDVPAGTAARQPTRILLSHTMIVWPGHAGRMATAPHTARG